MIRVVHPGSGFLPIPDLRSRGPKGTGSRIHNAVVNDELFTNVIFISCS
jgi:hypothetical protein